MGSRCPRSPRNLHVVAVAVAEAQRAAGRVAAVLPHEAAVDDGPFAALAARQKKRQRCPSRTMVNIMA